MKGLTLFVLVALVLVGPVVGWAQSPPSGQAPAGSSPASAPAQPGAPSATTPGTTVPDSTTPPTQAPATPGGTVPDTTTAQTPGGPGMPTDRPADAENRILGLSPLVATILGLAILGLIIALVVGRGRRDRDVIVDSRVEPGVGPDRPLDTYESEIERERRRRAS